MDQIGSVAEGIARARLGQVEAIGWLLNQALQPRGISARVWCAAQQLQILIVGDPLPRQQVMVGVLTQGLRRLHPPLIRKIQIYGRIRGGPTLAWMEQVDLLGPGLPDLEFPRRGHRSQPGGALQRSRPPEIWPWWGVWGVLALGLLALLGSEPDLSPWTGSVPRSRSTPAPLSLRDRYPDLPAPRLPPFDPRLLPPLDPQLDPDCEAARTGPYLQFLGDACGRKRFPTDLDRDRSCPVSASQARVSLPGGGMGIYRPATAAVGVDDQALVDWVPSALKVTVILIRRIEGVPHYRYLSNGTHDQPFQPWSASKFMAVANAAATLRIRSDYQVGLAASVDGHALGDLITSLHTYSYDPYSSNSLGRYFQRVAGADQANALIHGAWLGRPEAESFGGGYGAGDPPLSYRFTEADGRSLQIQPQRAGLPNRLSTLTLAETLKRLVMHREDPTTRLPGGQWSDLQVLLYGSESASSEWGGMSRDLSLYLQSTAMDYLTERSRGQWRTVSKMGLGDGELVSVGYACFPALDDRGRILPDWGREFVIAAQLETGGSSWSERDRLLAQYHSQIIQAIIKGQIQ